MSLSEHDAIEKYRRISKKLADPALLFGLRKLFARKYSLEELLNWLHEKVKWEKGDMLRHYDPLEIIAYGKGRCGEFATLFTALCLAHGYRARLILDMTDHVWTEVWNEEKRRWVHVDPSEKRIDDPLMYERDWKKNLTEIYAFENGKTENVTKNYKKVNRRQNEHTANK
ncbi:MAG: transglutaminase-like domain-containing protein [Candidatus Bathyarchaeales archaeon]